MLRYPVFGFKELVSMSEFDGNVGLLDRELHF